jgi:hypothetical protein
MSVVYGPLNSPAAVLLIELRWQGGVARPRAAGGCGHPFQPVGAER